MTWKCQCPETKSNGAIALDPTWTEMGKPDNETSSSDSTEITWDRVYKARFNLKTRNKDGHRRVFVNEDLTATRVALAYRTTTLKKEGRIMDCWTVAVSISELWWQKWTTDVNCVSVNCVNQVNRINISVYQVVKYVPFRKSVIMNLFMKILMLKILMTFKNEWINVHNLI